MEGTVDVCGGQSVLDALLFFNKSTALECLFAVISVMAQGVHIIKNNVPL